MSKPERIESRKAIANEEVLASLEAILQSKTFSHGTSLRQVLEFIVRNNLSSSAKHIKEYTIATEVLGRKGDFDPKVDNIVRIQMGRLRGKLEEYYLAEGQRDPIQIVMPRGQYTPEYIRVITDVQPTTTDPPQLIGVSQVKRKRVDWRWGVGIALVICNLVLVANHLMRPWTRLSPPFRSLWAPFFLSGSPPLIVFGNPAFLMSKQGNLYRYDLPTILFMPMGSRVSTPDDRGFYPAGKEESGPFYYFDAYTGTGEVVAAAGLARFLTARGEPFLIKRSGLTSYDDIKNNNVIFLGSDKQDQILKNLPVVQELVFELPPPDQYTMGSYIRDMNPPPGYPATYGLQLNPSTGAIQVDYGLISLLPGVSAGHHVLVLAGITTLATQAAGDFVTSQRDMALLEQMPAVATAMKSRSASFQALLEVKVRDGVPLDATCLLVRDLNRVAR
ncbi:MAG TPA: hypothetical protein VMW54_00750 [Terriglobia bacterium]|nr:hypothetical protein [Terriglobia bacterium]